MHTYTHAHINTCTFHTCIHPYMCASTHLPIHTDRIHASTHPHVHVFIHSHTCTRTHAHAFMHMCTHARLHTTQNNSRNRAMIIILYIFRVGKRAHVSMNIGLWLKTTFAHLLGIQIHFLYHGETPEHDTFSTRCLCYRAR